MNEAPTTEQPLGQEQQQGAAPASQQDGVQPGAVTEGQKTDAGGEQEAPQTEAQESTEQKAEREKGRYQRRLDRHKEARYRAEAEAKVWRDRAAELEARSTQQQPANQPPKRDDFDTYEDYLDARQDYRAEQGRSKDQRGASRGGEQRQPAADRTATQWQEREKAFEAKTRDYKDSVHAFLEEDINAFSGEARRAIVELGPEVLYHMSKNPEVADRISGLSPVRQVAELAKLEEKISSQPAKRPSNAPPPITPVGSPQTANAGYRDNMSQSEYEKWARDNGAKLV